MYLCHTWMVWILHVANQNRGSIIQWLLRSAKLLKLKIFYSLSAFRSFWHSCHKNVSFQISYQKNRLPIHLFVFSSKNKSYPKWPLVFKLYIFFFALVDPKRHPPMPRFFERFKPCDFPCRKSGNPSSWGLLPQLQHQLVVIILQLVIWWVKFIAPWVNVVLLAPWISKGWRLGRGWGFEGGWFVCVYYVDIWGVPKIGVPPNHPLKNRVFHDFHHPFWGTTILANTHMVIEYVILSYHILINLYLYTWFRE